MPRRRSEQLEIAQRRQKVAALYVRHYSLREIEAEVGVDHATVGRDLAALREEWLASSLMDFNARKAEELSRLDQLERVAWSAWERSCRDAEKTVKKRVPAGDGHRVETTHTREGQAGDPRFLERVGWCIDRRCELLGLDPPKRQEMTFPEGVPLNPEQADEGRRRVEEYRRGRAQTGASNGRHEANGHAAG